MKKSRTHSVVNSPVFALEIFASRWRVKAKALSNMSTGVVLYKKQMSERLPGISGRALQVGSNVRLQEFQTTVNSSSSDTIQSHVKEVVMVRSTYTTFFSW